MLIFRCRLVAFLDSFSFTTMKHKEKFSSWITDTSDLHVYEYICVYIYAYVRIIIRICAYKHTQNYVRINIRVCACNHTHMCLYSYAYVRIKRVCAVNIYLSGTVDHSTKTVQNSIKNISGNIKAVFLKLGNRNVHHKRNKMTAVMPLPWQQLCRWSCFN